LRTPSFLFVFFKWQTVSALSPKAVALSLCDTPGGSERNTASEAPGVVERVVDLNPLSARPGYLIPKL
jgi:hypothetical protein